jgi:hypothetical protein
LILFLSFSAFSFADFVQFSLSQADTLTTSGVLKEKFKEGQGLDVYRGYTTEWGITKPGSNSFWSLAYTTLGADSKVTKTLDTNSAGAINDTYGLSTTLKTDDSLYAVEKLDLSYLMIKYNYSGDIAENIFYNLSIGAGCTYATATLTGTLKGDEIITTKDNDKALAGVVGLGLGYQMTENSAFIINYEYKAAKAMQFESTAQGKVKIANASLDLGYRFNF